MFTSITDFGQFYVRCPTDAVLILRRLISVRSHFGSDLKYKCAVPLCLLHYITLHYTCA